MLDLGCGWGELLLRAVDSGTSATSDRTTGIGVDTDESGLERGRALAAERGLDGRVTFVRAQAGAWDAPADRVLCIGASHAWGGTPHALTALAGIVPPGGRLLFGDGCWENPPTKAATAIFGDDVESLLDLVEHATSAGWRVLHLSSADQREWDDFESTWRAGRQEWLLDNPTDERSPALREEMDIRLAEYISGYRGVLGFGYLVLGR